jgi:hypothetical protein
MFGVCTSRVGVVILLGTAAVSAQVTVGILQTDPPSPAVLSKMDWLNLRVAYDSGQEVQFSADCYYKGKRVFDENHFLVSGFQPAGQGEAAVAIAFADSRKVDVVKVYAWGKSSAGVIGEASLPVDFAWNGKASSSSRPVPDWARNLEQDEQRDRARTTSARAWSPMDLVGAALGFLMFSPVLAYVVLQVLALSRLRGGWLQAATVPVIPMLLVLLYTIYAYANESNLWPLILLFTSPLAGAYLLAVFGLAWLNGKSKPAPSPVS